MDNKPFLPDDYEPEKATSGYFRFKTGDNNIRILSSAVMGYQDWIDNKPVRSKDPLTPHDVNKKVQPFWSFVVWNYDEEAVQIMTVTQATIKNAIRDLITSDDWGDPKGYDLNIKRTGEDLETRYSVVPKPPKDLSKEVKEAYEAMEDINLEKLFTGQDPFNFAEPLAVNPDDVPFKN